MKFKSRVKIKSLKFVLFIFGASFLFYSCKSQEVIKPDIDLSTVKYYSMEEVDNIAQPKGGTLALHKNVKYPHEALRKELSGKIVMEFLIDDDGKAYFVSFITRTQSVLDKAAVNAVRKTPFIPASKNGSSVSSIANVPITFQNFVLN